MFELCYAVKSANLWKTVYTYCLTPVGSAQTNRKPWRVKQRVPVSASQRVSSLTKCQSLDTVWHVETQSRATATLPALFASLQLNRNVQFPWCLPGFIYPQAKRADTMKVYSRKVINSSCLLLHMAASQAYIYKECNENNLKKKNTSAVCCNNKSSGNCHRHCHINKFS